MIRSRLRFPGRLQVKRPLGSASLAEFERRLQWIRGGGHYSESTGTVPMTPLSGDALPDNVLGALAAELDMVRRAGQPDLSQGVIAGVVR